MEYIFNLEDFTYFLDKEFFPTFQEILEYKISIEKIKSFLITGTLKLIKLYDKSSVPYLRIAPIHRNLEEDYEYWNYLFPTEYWIEFSKKIEKCLNLENEFSKVWTIQVGIWLYSFIDPEKSPKYIEYYLPDKEEQEQEEKEKEKDTTDKYLIDYQSD